MKVGTKKKVYDWDRLKLEWLTTGMTPNAFAKSKNIPIAFFLSQ